MRGPIRGGERAGLRGDGVGEARWVPPCLLTLSLSPLPMSGPFSVMRLTVQFVHFSLSPSPWSASVHLSASLPPSFCVLVSLSPSFIALLCLSPSAVPVRFSPASLPLSWGLSMGPSPCPPAPCFLPVFPPLPPGYEKSRSLSSIAGLSGVSLRLAPLATPPGSPRATRRAPPTLPSIL
ncbi:hypothetical protein HJG60_009046 [Phyllostomus discolor]|uniref:Uncharacterized protein n=1 Tax=Phyllostomus discolor TaxID=89673 RepID=A0A834DEY3_9CHIR|nr:hypothetical protein HJG60_009046 [Phyllostomus discolor]